MTVQAEHSAQDAFDIKQYELLFERNVRSHEMRFRHIELSIAAIGIFYAAFINASESPIFLSVARFVIYIPFVIALSGFLLSQTLRFGMIERGKVMLQIEARLNRPGWETEIQTRGHRLISESQKMILAGWLPVLVLTLLIATLSRIPGA